MITIKSKEEIKILREGGKILANILKDILKKVEPGITTGELEKIACDLIEEDGGRPSFKGYKSVLGAKAFPTALCISINNEVVHAPTLPSRKLASGDIVGIDVGMEYPYKRNASGYYTDMAITLGVGEISKEAEKLIKVAKKSLELAIKQVKSDNTLNDVSSVIQTYVEAQGFSVVRELVGHGVGYDVHEEPKVPNYVVDEGKKFNDVVLKSGMVIAIEPMVNEGDWKVKTAPDGFTVLTVDKSLSAHFEHTVAVTDGGYLVLTEL